MSVKLNILGTFIPVLNLLSDIAFHLILSILTFEIILCSLSLTHSFLIVYNISYHLKYFENFSKTTAVKPNSQDKVLQPPEHLLFQKETIGCFSHSPVVHT